MEPNKQPDAYVALRSRQKRLTPLLDTYAAMRAKNWDAAEAAATRLQFREEIPPGNYAYYADPFNRLPEKLSFIAIAEHSEEHRFYALCLQAGAEQEPLAIPLKEFIAVEDRSADGKHFRGGLFKLIERKSPQELLREWPTRLESRYQEPEPGYYDNFKRWKKSQEDDASFQYAVFGVARATDTHELVAIYTALYPPHAGHLLARPQRGGEAGFLDFLRQRQVRDPDGEVRSYTGYRFNRTKTAQHAELAKHILNI